MLLISVCAFVVSRNSSTYFISRSASARGRQSAAIVRQKRMHQIPEDVIDRDVALLHAMDAIRAHYETVIELGCRHLAARPSCKSDGLEAHFPCLDEGVDQILGVATCGKADEAVVRAPKGYDLARENMCEANIVSDR